jgi:hypothetical protein
VRRGAADSRSRARHGLGWTVESLGSANCPKSLVDQAAGWKLAWTWAATSSTCSGIRASSSRVPMARRSTPSVLGLVQAARPKGRTAEDQTPREMAKGGEARSARSDGMAEADGNRTRLSRVAAHTGFEDLNSSANVGNGSKVTGQEVIVPNIVENLTQLRNVSNGDSVPATVPASEPHASTRLLIKAQVGGRLRKGAIKARSLQAHLRSRQRTHGRSGLWLCCRNSICFCNQPRLCAIRFVVSQVTGQREDREQMPWESELSRYRGGVREFLHELPGKRRAIPIRLAGSRPGTPPTPAPPGSTGWRDRPAGRCRQRRWSSR